MQFLMLDLTMQRTVNSKRVELLLIEFLREYKYGDDGVESISFVHCKRSNCQNY